MRALRKVGPEPGLQLCDIPEPVAGLGQVKIRVQRAGLCGTDLHIFNSDGGAPGQMHYPMTLGHEFFGEICEIGPGVVEGHGPDELHVGMLVSVEGHVVCGRCRNCRAGRKHMCIRSSGIGVNQDGGFADYVVVPAANVWVLGDLFEPELGALFDPFGNAVHTCQQAELSGADVLITGAGPIGVMTAAIARHNGARRVVVTDVNPRRLKMALAAGADLAIDASKQDPRDLMGDLGMREGFDVGLEMSGAPLAMQSLIDSVRHGGTIAMLGLPNQDFGIDWRKVITHMFTIKGVYGRQMFDTWYLATFMLETSPILRERIRGVITHEVNAEDWAEAFELASSGAVGKVIMDWSK